MIYAVDFETFYSSDYTVKKGGMDEYCLDERFDPYLVAIVGPGVGYAGPLPDAPWEKIHGHEWVSHNAAFDQRVFNQAKAIGMITPLVRPQHWHCSADLTAYLQHPRNLKDAMKEFFGEDFSKEKRAEMRGKHFADLSVDGQDAMLNYALADAAASLRIWTTHHDKWPLHEQILANHAREAGMRGVCVDEPGICAGLAKLERVKADAAAQIPWAKGGKVTSLRGLSAACLAAGIPAPHSTAEDSPDCMEWEKIYGRAIPWVRAVRDWRKSNRMAKVLESMLRRTDPVSKLMPFNLKYFGAGATGRWSGDAGINMQNLPRAEQYGVNVRHLIKAAPGHLFVSCDLSQIEPRVLAWMCGDTPLLEQMASGMDLYEAHARATMGYTDPRPLKQGNPDMRTLSKIRCLGLGYGCGPVTFVSIAATYGVTLTAKQSKRIVEDYRATNPLITGFWDACYKQFIRAKGKDKEFELPSGRVISYFNVTTMQGGSAAIVRGKPARNWWGGKLCENMTQALARDVFAAAYLRVLGAGYDVKWTIHDELVVEVPEAMAPEAAKQIQSIMSQTPEWLPGCPIAADATIKDCYSK